MMNFFNLTLSGKHFICPSILNESFAGYSNLGCRSLPFMTWNTSFQPLLASQVSFKKSAHSLMETPLQVTVPFSLAAFKILSLSLILGNVIMMCLGPSLDSLGPTCLGLSELPGLPGSLCPLPDGGSSPSLCFQISFKFLALPLLLLAFLCQDVGTFKVVPEVPKPLLFLNSCFFILFWLNVISSFQSKPLISFLVSFPLVLVPCTFSFISLFIAFTFSSVLQPYSNISVSILITSVSNSVSDRLTVSSSISFIFGTLFFHLGHILFSQHACYNVRGRALSIHHGGATHVPSLWFSVWGGSQRGNNAACLAVGWLSITYPTFHKQIGPFWC